MVVFFFFFFKQKTAYEMRISDWSSDVCSSDLGVGTMLIGGIWTLFSLRKSLAPGIKSGFAAARQNAGTVVAETERDLPMKWMLVALVAFVVPLEIGRASGRERVCQYVLISAVAVTLKKTKKRILHEKRQ